MPLARNTFATAAASTSSLKSMVPTTWERSLGSATNGVVYERSCAQVYSRPEESAVRLTAQSSPPFANSQSSCSASNTSVAIAGVLYVWFLRLLSTAIGSERKSGTQRFDSAMASIRLSAAGLRIASHRPPSLAKFFCGAK